LRKQLEKTRNFFFLSWSLNLFELLLLLAAAALARWRNFYFCPPFVPVVIIICPTHTHTHTERGSVLLARPVPSVNI
jgi:hypothetical protein